MSFINGVKNKENYNGFLINYSLNYPHFKSLKGAKNYLFQTNEQIKVKWLA